MNDIVELDREGLIETKYSSSGTDIQNGAIRTYEANPRFTTPGAWAAYARQMTRTEARLAVLDMLVRHSILSPTWSAEPPRTGEDDEENENALRNADFINEAFGWAGKIGRTQRTWEDMLDSMSHYASIGFWVTEEVYKYEDGLYWLKDLADLEPDSIRKWEVDRDGELAAIRQYPFVQGEPAPKPLPADKALVVSLEKTGRNWEGVGLLRACVIWYEFKNLIIDQMGRGAVKWATPIPRVTVDRPPKATLEDETSAYTNDEINDQIAYAQNAAAKLAEGRAKWVSDTPIASLNTFGDSAFDATPALLASIQHANKEMSTRYAAQWIELGVNNTGSRSVGEVHYEAFRAMMVNLIDEIANTLGGVDRPGGGTVDRLLATNFYPTGIVPAEERPLIKHSGLAADAIADGLDKIIALAEKGLLDIDLELKNRLRGLFKLTQLRAEEEEALKVIPDVTEDSTDTPTGEDDD